MRRNDECRMTNDERKAACCTVALILVALVAAQASAQTIRSKDIEVTVRPGGSGLVDEVKYKGEVVMSTTTTGHAPMPGFEVDAERTAAAAKLTAKLAMLQTDAPCRISETKSARGHQLLTLENGLLKVTAMTWFGGRILRIESKLTGQNFLDNPYDDRPDEVKGPKDMGGLWGELDDGIFQTKVRTQTDDEIAVVFTGAGEGLRIEKTLRLKRGSGVLEIEQKQLNTAESRDATNHFFGRFRIGGATGDEDVLWGSTRGRATRFHPRRSSPDCHTDPRTDRWAALCDVKEHVAMVGVFDGPVVRVGTWIRPEFYQLECWTPAHFTLAPEATMTTTWRLATCFNMDGVAFADEEFAVGIVPEAEVVSTGAKDWRTRVAAVSFRKGPAAVMLKARFIDRHGRVVKELGGVTVACRFLVAEPQLVPFNVADLPAGDYDMHVTLESGGRKAGETTLALRRADAGPILEVFRPVEAEKDKVFPVLGSVERGRVQVASVTVTSPVTIRVAGNQRHAGGDSPFTAEIRLNDEGDGFEIRHTLTVKPGADERVRAAGLALPLVLGNDWYNLKTTVGGEKLNDAWRFDQEDEAVYTPTVSDYFSRWPLWKLGGVLQDSPSHYRIWKASDWDVAPMTTLEGTAAPGWVEVNNRRHGVRIEMSDMSSKAPRELLVDGETGTALVWFYPPHVPPIRLASSGDPAAPSLADRLQWLPGKPWTNTVSVRFRSGPHAFGFKRDVSDAAFRAALEALGDPAVPRSMTAIPLPTGTLEQCIQDLLDSDVTLRDYLRRAVGGGYRIRGLCQKLGCKYSNDFDETIETIVRMLKEKYP